VLDSVSRLQSKLATPQEAESARRIRDALSLYRQSEDLINLGAYVSGSNARLDTAIRSRDEIMKFLRQKPTDCSTGEETARRLEALAGMV